MGKTQTDWNGTQGLRLDVVGRGGGGGAGIAGKEVVLCFRYGRVLAEHIVMYFQVCSNSAYPMHSGELYRTNAYWDHKAEKKATVGWRIPI